MDHPPKVPSAKKQADDAKRLARLLLLIETNLKARDANQTGKANLRSVRLRAEQPTTDAYNFTTR